MGPRDSEVRSLAERVRALPEEEREAFLLESCGDDVDLLTEVYDLLGDDASEAQTPVAGAAGIPSSAANFIDRFREELTRTSRKVQALAIHEDLYHDLIHQLEGHGTTYGRYEIHSEVGRGGMGVVYEATDLHLRRRVALKRIRDTVEDEAAGITPREAPIGVALRFLHEAQITAQLDHPNVLGVHELGIDSGGTPFFTMPLIRGRSLGERLHELGRIPVWDRRWALNALVAAARAAAHAHGRGVVHRDLKPGNILLSDHGAAYVMDWGVARVTDEETGARLAFDPDSVPDVSTSLSAAATEETAFRTAQGQAVGTPSFMSPEQAEGRRSAAHPAADVFSLGAILYQLLTGHPPFTDRPGKSGERPTGDELLERTRNQSPTPIADLNSGAPGELIAIAERAMARRPELRFADAGAFALDLEAYLDGRVVQSYERGGWAQLRKWIRRNKLPAAALVLAVVSLAGGSTSVMAIERRRANEAEVQLDQIRRLSRMQDAERLLNETQRLWPADERVLPRLQSWLADARDLLAERSTIEEHLAQLESRARPRNAEELKAALRAHPQADELIEWRAELALLSQRRKQLADETAAELEAEGAEASQDTAAGRLEASEELTRQLDAFDVRVTEVRSRVERTELQIHEEIALVFDDPRDRWWQGQIRDYLSALDDLEQLATPSEDLIGPHGPSIASRLALAEAFAAREAEAGWNEAWARCREDQQARGEAVLVRDRDLLPLRRNPHSDLWEFVALSTGSPPELDAELGDWALTEATGVVLTLIPGGRYLMGSQSRDPSAPNFGSSPVKERPVHGVTLAPYLISRYELSQAQWTRMAATAPAQGTRRGMHPVESITYVEAAEILSRFDLVLPTEAQWEAAARGDRDTNWWTGQDKASLLGRAVLDMGYLDPASRQRGMEGAHPWPLRPRSHQRMDGAPQNPFGLLHVHGNVAEWCLDSWAPYDQPTAPGTGERLAPSAVSVSGVTRGASYRDAPWQGRSSRRVEALMLQSSRARGVRPARLVSVLEPLAEATSDGATNR